MFYSTRPHLLLLSQDIYEEFNHVPNPRQKSGPGSSLKKYTVTKILVTPQQVFVLHKTASRLNHHHANHEHEIFLFYSPSPSF